MKLDKDKIGKKVIVIRKGELWYLDLINIYWVLNVCVSSV